jgi:hypothetical protein
VPSEKEIGEVLFEEVKLSNHPGGVPAMGSDQRIRASVCVRKPLDKRLADSPKRIQAGTIPIPEVSKGLHVFPTYERGDMCFAGCIALAAILELHSDWELL